ncbi:BMP family ABC transporter substrate-binding protein [Desertibacillus haloalkaliphilus]|uniref:BMP family ABC transporter substrate-binding protein n=1 Tax=Desertibacillus haloalkaliphilus TaxID=1328930 RepID=UPI001C255AAE|nr:BMP family ABC transporter substrate-binding protein [Desertibacillus haloalkaliphilus]MBU8907937.1 BMP family ABC transporter substrate-binding protein [Desertibacillus haloalkaliphilus]
MSQKKILSRIIITSIILASALIISVAFRVYTITMNDNEGTAIDVEDFSVGIITSDRIYDQSWGSLAYEGKQRIREEFQVQVELVSERDTDEKIAQTVRMFIDHGHDIIIGHGREFSDVFTKVAPDYEHIHFVTINGTSQHDNQSVFTFHNISHGYFTGLVAALMTETNKIAIIDPFKNTDEGTVGFKYGVKSEDSSITLIHKVVNSRDDEHEAALLAREAIEDGADVIFTKGNAYNRAVIHEAEGADVYAIGYLDDQAYMARDHVITSVMVDIPETYISILRRFLRPDGLRAGETVLDFKDGVYKFAPLGPMVSDEIENKLKDTIESYNNGSYIIDIDS